MESYLAPAGNDIEVPGSAKDWLVCCYSFLTWVTNLPDFSTYSAQVEVISMVTGKHKTLAKLSGD